MKIAVITTFPEILQGTLEVSMLKRAREAGLFELRFFNPRDETDDPHQKTDDEQYGGGSGMVMLAEPVLRSADRAREWFEEEPRVILMSPTGKPFQQKHAERLTREGSLLFICGHYKGVDDRVREILKAEEISIGDFVLTGGEVPALAVIDAVVRLLPGAVGGEDSVESDSFTSGLLDCPRYTRPREVRGVSVPDVLISGNHAQIRKWRFKKALEKTRAVRPDLLKEYNTLEGLEEELKGKREQ